MMTADSAYGIACAADCAAKGPPQASTERTAKTAETECGTTYCPAKSSSHTANSIGNPAGTEAPRGST